MEIIRASLDRFEDDCAVIYVEKDHRRFDLPREMVHDAKPGMRLLLHVDGDYIDAIEVDYQETEDARDRIKRKYQKLRNRRPEC